MSSPKIEEEQTLTTRGQEVLQEFLQTNLITMMASLPREDRANVVNIVVSIMKTLHPGHKNRSGSRSKGRRSKKDGPQVKPWTEAARLLDTYLPQKMAKKEYNKALKSHKVTRFADLPSSLDPKEKDRIAQLQSRMRETLDLWKEEVARTEGCYNPETGPPQKRQKKPEASPPSSEKKDNKQ